jgi:ATP-dependent exoDNAse (exonuclease V) alpha subunit
MPACPPVAIYHLSVKAIGRAKGRSATAAAAYRAAVRILDERTGLVHDYERKTGVAHTEIVVPEQSPAWARDRDRLWNEAELAERRRNSTVAREFEVTLPTELDSGQRQVLTRDFATEIVNRHRCAVDIAIHEPDREGDERNHHAHLLLTTRRLTEKGFADKTRELDDLKIGEVVFWRYRWAGMVNEHLAPVQPESATAEIACDSTPRCLEHPSIRIQAHPTSLPSASLEGLIQMPRSEVFHAIGISV